MFGCVGAEIKWDTVWFLAAQAILTHCGLHRKIRLIQWVELSWVVATNIKKVFIFKK